MPVIGLGFGPEIFKPGGVPKIITTALSTDGQLGNNSGLNSTSSRKVIIVGAGIAGSYAAAYAASQGLETRVLERATFERSCHPLFGRMCAEGVWLEKMQKAGFDFGLDNLPSWVNHVTRRLLVGRLAKGKIQTAEFETKPYLYLDRQSFERNNLAEAIERGGIVEYGQDVQDLEEFQRRDPDAIIIVAVGTNQRVVKQMLKPQRRSQYTLRDNYVIEAQYTFRGVDLSELGNFKGVFFSDNPQISYFHIFPKGNSRMDEVNVGVMCAKYNVAGIFRLLDDFIEATNRHFSGIFDSAEKIKERTFAKPNTTGSPIVLEDMDSIRFPNVLPVGDAAKQVGSLSGGGIGYALYAAKAAIGTIRDDPNAAAEVIQTRYFQAIDKLTRDLEMDAAQKPAFFPKEPCIKSAFLDDLMRFSNPRIGGDVSLSFSRISEEAAAVNPQLATLEPRFINAISEVKRLFESANTPYALIGGAAARLLGAKRQLSQDVDFMTTAEGLDKFIIEAAKHGFYLRKSAYKKYGATAELLEFQIGRASVHVVGNIEIIDGNGRTHCFYPDREMMEKAVDIDWVGKTNKIRVLSAEDLFIFKALWQRGTEVGKHDIDDAVSIFKNNRVRWDKVYLAKRLSVCGEYAFERIMAFVQKYIGGALDEVAAPMPVVSSTVTPDY